MFGLRQKLQSFTRRTYHLGRLKRPPKRRFSLPELQQLQLSRNEQYFYCVYFFDRFLPQKFGQHRHYFTQHRRGFGEDAFHAMWFLLFETFKPKKALEIGVYRGQTITLWKMLSQHFGFNCEVSGVSPFSAAGDAVSAYQEHVDYFEDVCQNHAAFNLPLPRFCRQFSTAPEAKDFIMKEQWDVIYIDGNHDYEVASQDWSISSRSVAPQGLIILDDASLGTDFSPPCFATAGHPGPSRVAREIDPAQFQEIFSVGHNRVFQRIA